MTELLYDQVIRWIPEKARVLDLGTGDGTFLSRLVREKKVQGVGVEKEPDLVAGCIEKGLVVHQGDIMDGLDQYAVSAFDYVLLLGTFQEVGTPLDLLREAFRVGRKVIIAYTNFAHFGIRMQIMFRGRSPVTRALPHAWYTSPNLHYFSIHDFDQFCRRFGLRQIETEVFGQRRKVRFLPNLFGVQAISILECTDARLLAED